MPTKNNRLSQPRDSGGRFTAKPVPVGAAPSSDTADSLRVVTQGLSALLTQIKIDRQNARRRVLTPEEKDLRGQRANAAIPGLKEEIKSLEDTLKNFATVESYKKYIEEQKVQAEKEKDKTKYQDAAESKFESGDFIGGMLFKFLGRNEPKKGDLKKEEEEKQLIEERLKLQDKLYGLQEREAKLQRLAGVAATPTPIAPVVTATPAEAAAKPVVTATPAEAAAKPETQILEEAARVKDEQTHIETQKQTTITQRTSDGIDKLWTEPINVNATVIDFSDLALKKLVTKLKDEGIGTGGGGSSLGVPLPNMPGIGGLVSTGASNFVKGGGPKLAAGSLGLGLAGAAGIYGGHKLEEAGYTKTGKVVHGAGTAASIGSMALAGGAIGTLFGPGVGTAIGYALGGLAGAIINWEDTSETFKDVGKMFSDSVDKFSNSPKNNNSNSGTMGSRTESDYKGRAGKNLNPGNIRQGGGVGPKYMGTVGSDDQGFSVFKSEELGTRAVFKDVKTKLEEGYDTPRKIIERYAPQVDNNSTDAYLKTIKDVTGLEADIPISPKDNQKVAAITRAIIKQESGIDITKRWSPEDLHGIQRSADESNEAYVVNNILKGIKPLSEPATPAKAAAEPVVPATPAKPQTPVSTPVPVPNPATSGVATYGNAVANTELNAQPKVAPSVNINNTNNLVNTTSGSSQKEARDRFLPMPNYFYNVDGTSCAC